MANFKVIWECYLWRSQFILALKLNTFTRILDQADYMSLNTHAMIWYIAANMRVALTPRDAASYDLSSDWTETDSPTLIFQRAWNASETLMIRLLDGCTIFGEVHSFYADGDIIIKNARVMTVINGRYVNLTNASQMWLHCAQMWSVSALRREQLQHLPQNLSRAD